METAAWRIIRRPALRVRITQEAMATTRCAISFLQEASPSPLRPSTPRAVTTFLQWVAALTLAQVRLPVALTLESFRGTPITRTLPPDGRCAKSELQGRLEQ